MKDKKKTKVDVNKLIAENVLDVDDLMMFIAQEECRKANGVVARLVYYPGKLLLPGIGDLALATHYVRLAQDYLRAHGLRDIPVTDVHQLLSVVMADRMKLIIINPTKYVDMFGGKLPEKAKKRLEKSKKKGDA